MKNIEVPAIYIAEDMLGAKEEERLERILTRISTDVMVIAPASKIYKRMVEEEWYTRERRTWQTKSENPSMIFSAFDWSDERNNPLKKRAYDQFIPARFNFVTFRDRKRLKNMGVLCNSGSEIHTTFGCLHSCSYCHIGNALTVMLDIERFIGKLGVFMQNNKKQKLFKYDNQGDVPLLEPEYGAIDDLIRFFAKTDRHLMLYTKSDNLYYLPDEEVHNNHTILCMTISCSEVAKKYELNAPGLEERLSAAKHCQKKGYRFRARFSPVIPIPGWKEKNREMIERLFAETSPEVISMEMLCHMTRSQLKGRFSGLEIEPQENPAEYVLFPHEARHEVYEFLINTVWEQAEKRKKKVKVALCLETREMWDELSPILKQKPNNFYCCCGASCV